MNQIRVLTYFMNEKGEKIDERNLYFFSLPRMGEHMMFKDNKAYVVSTISYAPAAYGELMLPVMGIRELKIND